MRKKILLLAYSISPVRGSEYSVGWNHVVNMSHFFELTVLYGLAGDHLGDVEEIQDYIREFGCLENVKFISVSPPLLARIFNFPNRKGHFVYSFYLAYRIWHKAAYRKARSIIERENISLVHYLCPIGFREPGYLWKLDLPYVWGPIGGFVPTKFLPGSPCSRDLKVKVWLKNFLNYVQARGSIRVRRAIRRADVILAATSENRDLILSIFDRESEVLPENGIVESSQALDASESNKANNHKLQLVWIGSLDDRKCPELLIDAVAKLNPTSFSLDIIGDGPNRARLKKHIDEHGLSSAIRLHGFIGRDDVGSILAQADLHVITSMSEGNPTVLWEAMAKGVPTLSVDHCGMRDTICTECGFLVELSDYDDTRDRITQKLLEIVDDKTLLERKSKALPICGNQHLWRVRSRKWLRIYEDAEAIFFGRDHKR